jgi:sulfur-oxidizing protein SoxZ
VDRPPQPTELKQENTMADPMRIRAQAAGDKATVRVLMSHEMETGQRKDSSGKSIPAWFIQEVTAAHNGKHRADGPVGPGGVEEPLHAVQRQGREGRRQDHDLWVDNKGDKRTDEATVS